MQIGLKITKRWITYLTIAIIYGLSANSVLASSALRDYAGSELKWELVFNLSGALIGGIAQLCISLNSSKTFVGNPYAHGLRNIFLSLFVGFLCFFITEPNSFWSIESETKQLVFVTLGGVFASEAMEKIRKMYFDRLEKLAGSVGGSSQNKTDKNV